MSPTTLHVLLGLWIVVGGIVTVATFFVIGLRNGFHIRSQENRETGLVEDSTLKWLAIVAGLFMSVPTVFLGISIVGSFLYELTATLAEFWWVPILLAALAVAGFLIVRRQRLVVVSGIPPVEEPAPPPPYQPMPYGTFGSEL